MNVTGMLQTLVPAWPAEYDEASKLVLSGHWAVFATTMGDPNFYLQPVVGWGVIESEVRNAVPMVWDEGDGCLMPAVAFENFVGLLEPGEHVDALKDDVTEKLSELSEGVPGK